MSIPDPDPVHTPRCPWCNSSDRVTEATGHERQRTQMRWFCERNNRLFAGTATEYQRIRAQVVAAEAEAMTTRPEETR